MERDIFEKLYWELYPELLRFARRQLRAGSEDVVAETFLTLWRKGHEPIDSDEEYRRFRALSYAVLRGHIANEHRRLRRRLALHARLQSRRVDADADVSQSADATHLLQPLARRDREILLLVHAGFTTNEIALVLDISTPAAQKRIGRAKQRLRETLEREGG